MKLSIEALELKLAEIFKSVFDVSDSMLSTVSYQSVESWDSIGHMMMIAEVEDAFSISIAMEDVITISNFEECKKIVLKYV